MKPAWDKLMKQFEGSATALVADVDCTSAGKPLCDANGVQGFPTIKYGDPSALEKYEGGRDFDTLKAFADSNLKPLCSPANIDLCDAEQTTKINDLLAMSLDTLKNEIKDGEKGIEKAEQTFKTELSKLQAAYQQLMADKDDMINSIKDDGLGLKKAVFAHRMKVGDKDEL